jgi:rhomboid protease GluP
MAGAFGGGQKEPRPRLCPACGRLVGSTATKCHECGASLTFSLAAASRSLSQLMPTESPITYFMLGINFVLFVLSMMITLRVSESPSLMSVHYQALIRLGAMFTPDLVAGEWWRLVMPIFLHGGIMHILFNTWVLMDLGPQVEENYGSSRYLFLYLITGIAGFILSAAWGIFISGPRMSIGASGSLMGLIGLMIAISMRRGGNYMRMLRASLVRWLIYILVLGFLFHADQMAHLGGLGAGYLLGFVFDDSQPVAPKDRKRAYALGWLAALVIVVSFVLMLQNYFSRTG